MGQWAPLAPKEERMEDYVEELLDALACELEDELSVELQEM